MAEMTEGDREKAREVLRSILVGLESTTVEIVAAALAEEREKARAPFLALADEMDSNAKCARDDGDPYWVPLSSVEYYADLIRRAAEVTE